MAPQFRLSELNTMDVSAFVEALGNIVEFFPVLAAAIHPKRPFASREHLLAEAHRVMDALPFEGESQTRNFLLKRYTYYIYIFN